MSEKLEKQVGRLVGLGRRSRGLVMGVPQVEQALRAKKAHVVLAAKDGSFGQKKGVFGLGKQAKVPVVERFTGQQMAQWLGIPRVVTAVAITDPNLARGILMALEAAPPEPAPQPEESVLQSAETAPQPQEADQQPAEIAPQLPETSQQPPESDPVVAESNP